jgi:hypothetical protein
MEIEFVNTETVDERHLQSLRLEHERGYAKSIGSLEPLGLSGRHVVKFLGEDENGVHERWHSCEVVLRPEISAQHLQVAGQRYLHQLEVVTHVVIQPTGEIEVWCTV